MVKVSGDVDEVANQYSLDNLQTEVSDGATPETAEDLIENLQLNILNNSKIRPEDDIKFEISYDVKKDIETYIAFSMTEVDRNIWIYNDNSLDYMTQGPGQKKAVYSCKLDQVNDLKLKLQVSVRNNKDELIAFADEKVFMINRTDLADDDLSAKDSATGLIQRNGGWKFG